MTTHLTHAALVDPGTLARRRGAGPNRAEIQRAAYLARYRNAHTRENYGIALKQWFRWCHEHNLDPLEAERGHVELFLRELEATGRVQSTISHKLTALTGFYSFALRDGAITIDPMAYVKRPKIERRSTRQALTRFETAAVLAAAEEHFSPQLFAFLTVLAESGLRVSEAYGIDIEHLTDHRGQLAVTIIRKGSKTRHMQFSYDTAFAISRHLEVAGWTTGALFRTATGLRLDRRTAGRMVDRAVRKAGITGKRITPHSFRHAWCTMARDAQMDPRAIQAAGGWADPRMMDYYDSGRDDARLSGIVANGVTAWIRGAA